MYSPSTRTDCCPSTRKSHHSVSLSSPALLRLEWAFPAPRLGPCALKPPTSVRFSEDQCQSEGASGKSHFGKRARACPTCGSRTQSINQSRNPRGNLAQKAQALNRLTNSIGNSIGNSFCPSTQSTRFCHSFSFTAPFALQLNPHRNENE